MPSIADLVGFLDSGKENAKTARVIAEHFGISDGGVEVSTRDLIRMAIDDSHVIGSTNNGFFIIENKTEFNEYINSLNGRIIGITRRIEKLHEAWASREQQ